jgi:hypothetical protein
VNRCWLESGYDRECRPRGEDPNARHDATPPTGAPMEPCGNGLTVTEMGQCWRPFVEDGCLRPLPSLLNTGVPRDAPADSSSQGGRRRAKIVSEFGRARSAQLRGGSGCTHSCE